MCANFGFGTLAWAATPAACQCADRGAAGKSALTGSVDGSSAARNSGLPFTAAENLSASVSRCGFFRMWDLPFMPQLDIFTVYLAMIAAGLAFSLVWLVVARAFPTLHAARYWFGKISEIKTQITVP